MILPVHDRLRTHVARLLTTLYSLDATSRVLRDNGNMSSPSVLFALEETLKDGGPNGDGDLWLVSFGAGFAAHSCRIGH